MRCNICDSSLSKPDYNADLGGYEPCITCLEAIQDALDGFIDKPYASEDAFGDDNIIPLYAMTREEESYDPYE